MPDDDFNMSLRKFLKQLGVTSQRQIEDAVRQAREAGGLGDRRSVRARAVVSLDGLDLEHVVEADISLKGAP